jgi:hypothetical protein
MARSRLSDKQRREAFRVLVLSQDMGTSVEDSRQMMAETFGLDEAQVLEIEKEGIAAGWPPLDNPSPAALGGTAVNVRIVFLQSAGLLQEALRNDGWQLSDGPAGHCDASHPEVRDQQAARSRLARLGLLTSARLRINFPPSPTSRGRPLPRARG